MSRDHEVILYTDGRHSSVYIYEPPMNVRRYTAPVDEMVDLGIDTINYAVGDCRVLLYDTKAGERWGHNVTKANHLIFYRAGLNLEQFIASGHDPLNVVCNRAHELGFNFVPSLIMGMQHQQRAEANDCRCSDFCFDHPEYQVGPEPDFPEAKWDDPTRFSYAIPEVRENRLRVIEELVTRYETDGIELNLIDYAPHLARREIAEHTDTFTQFIGQVRTQCDDASRKQNRPKRLIVRAAASLQGNKAIGIDLATLIGDQIVDTVLAMPPHKREPMEQHPGGIADLVSAAQGKKVNIIRGISTNIVHDAYHHATREMIAAQAANGYREGAGGVFFSTYYPMGYPYSDGDYETLRYMGRPELLAHKDKHFAVRSGPNGGEDPPGDYGSPNPLPVDLKTGERGAPQALYVSDDLKAKQEAGELAKCELRVRIQGFIDTDTFDLWLNDQLIGREDQEWIDWTFSVKPPPGKTWMLGTYWFTVDLNRCGPLPLPGDNTVRVDLTGHDSRSAEPISLVDVELVVNYRDHRHSPRRDEWWYDPQQMRPGV